MTGWCFRAEVEVNAAISIFRHLGIALVVFAGVRHLLALQHRAGLRVVNDKRPEALSGWIGRDVEFVGFGAIQVGAAAIPGAEGVLGPDTGKFKHHRRRVHRGQVEEQRASIHVTATIAAIHEVCVVAAGETGLPITGLAGIDVCLGILRCKQNRTCRRIANGDRFSQQGFLFPGRIERLAFLNANGRGHTQEFRGEHLGGLALDHLIQFLVELEVVGMDGVHI